MCEALATKTCTKCKQTKPLTVEFWQPRPERPIGWFAQCKDCRNANSLKFRAAPGKFFQRQAVNAASRFNIAIETAKTWIRRRETLPCEICGSTVKRVIDHHHGDGHLRGILCDLCNKGIGQLGDNLDILRSAVRYLERHRGADIRPYLAS